MTDEERFLELMDGMIIRVIKRKKKNCFIMVKNDDAYFYKYEGQKVWKFLSATTEYFREVKNVSVFVNDMMKKHGL